MSTASTEPQSWDQAVLDEMESHVESERDLLVEYARAAQEVEAPDLRFLINLILEDERRHHQLFQEMARALEGVRQWRTTEPAIPPLSHRPLPEEVRKLTDRFLAAERDDRRQLRALGRRLRPVADTTLWSLLVDLMLLDTEKHLHILGFIADHAEG